MQNQALLFYLLLFFSLASSSRAQGYQGCLVESLNSSAYLSALGSSASSARVFSLAPSLLSTASVGSSLLPSALVCREMCALALYTYAGVAHGTTCLCVITLAPPASSPWLLTAQASTSCTSNCTNGDQCGAPDPVGRTDSPLVLSVYTSAHNLLTLGLEYGSNTAPLFELSPISSATSTASVSMSIVASLLTTSGTTLTAEVILRTTILSSVFNLLILITVISCKSYNNIYLSLIQVIIKNTLYCTVYSYVQYS